MCNIVGIRVLNDCVNNCLTPISGLIVCEQLLLTICTMWFYWDENKITAIQPLTIVALVIPVSNLLIESRNKIQWYLACRMCLV